MVQEDTFVFEDKPKGETSKCKSFCHFLWNSETKEFCGRDGASWAKVSFFYAVFYLCLGGFFVGMLAVFFQIMPQDRPTYYGASGTISIRGVNPGLGFRPQIDVEDSLIYYSPLKHETSSQPGGHKQYVDNLKNFLASKYKPVPAEDDYTVIKNCEDGKSYVSELTSRKSCGFDYKKIFASTPCTEENKFGYETNLGCVLLKLNKIISWTPQVSNGSQIRIKCEGETAADKDNLQQVIYHSENHLQDTDFGYIDAKYFPFDAQVSYRAPFIWTQFKIPANVIVNIECKAYADNIDIERLNRRGLTKFTLFVENK